MIKRIAATALVFSVLVAIISIVLLLNFTAPNPTGRRYSSSSPVTTGGNSRQIGLSGEDVLSQDLGVPVNDRNDQRACICNAPNSVSISECRTCIAIVQLSSTYRRPDFVTDRFIAESKNAEELPYDGTRREADQIAEYAIAARALNRPLWVYVRVNTTVDRNFIELADSTGGGVIQYFTVPGYVDPIDASALRALAAAAGVFFVSLLLWSWARRSRPDSAADSPGNPSPRPIDGPEDFLNRAKKRARRDIDIEDSRPQ